MRTSSVNNKTTVLDKQLIIQKNGGKYIQSEIKYL